MFTGIVQRIGTVLAAGDGALWVDCGPSASKVLRGGSIAVDGVCLTAVGRRNTRLRFDLADETVRRTTLGGKTPGSRVNLELPLRLGDPLGGHLVQGHVDGVGRIVRIERERIGSRIWVAAPAFFRPWLVPKGSIALDGVSLTVAELRKKNRGPVFSVALIPHTLQVTTLGGKREGESVNLEADVFLKWAAAARRP